MRLAGSFGDERDTSRSRERVIRLNVPRTQARKIIFNGRGGQAESTSHERAYKELGSWVNKLSGNAIGLTESKKSLYSRRVGLKRPGRPRNSKGMLYVGLKVEWPLKVIRRLNGG